jgi:hypothetical protein
MPSIRIGGGAPAAAKLVLCVRGDTFGHRPIGWPGRIARVFCESGIRVTESNRPIERPT